MRKKRPLYSKKISWFAFDVTSTEKSLSQSTNWKPGDILRFRKRDANDQQSPIVLGYNALDDAGQTALLPYHNKNNEILPQDYYKDLFSIKCGQVMEDEETEMFFMVVSFEETYSYPYCDFLFENFNYSSLYYNNREYCLLSKHGFFELWTAWLPRLEKCFAITHMPKNLDGESKTG